MLLAMIPALGGCGGTNKPKAVLIVADAFGDASFYDSAKAGAQRLEKDGIASVQYVECKGANYDAKLREAAGSAELVLAVGWKFENIAVIASEYPDVKFVWADGVLPELPENLLCVTYAQNEGAFLAGYLAASLSKSEKIGMIGGDKSDIIGEYLAGYQQGAAYANPSCVVQSAFIGSFLDAEAAKSEALTLAENGCDVIFHAAGAAGNGVFKAADEKDFYAIGADSDQKHLDEEHIVASVVKDIGSSLYDLTAAYAKGDWEGGRTWNTNMKTGYIGLGYGAAGSVQQVSDELKKEIEQIAEKIKSGELVVQTVPESGGQKIAVIRNLTGDDHTKSFFEGAVEKGVYDGLQESPVLWTASAYVDAKVIGETCMELLGQKLSGEITPAQYTFDASLKKASDLK